MNLPGRLRASTLGDLLGTVHRARANGTLELVEDRGRAHRVHLASGLVVAVELDGASASLGELLRKDRSVEEGTLRRSLLRAMASRRLHGEVLVRDFHLSPSVVGSALRRQLLLRLAALEKLPDARVSFRVTMKPPRGALSDVPLVPAEFLRGRRRARDRDRDQGRSEARALSPVDVACCRILGIAPDADEGEIKRAYRALARCYHPDLHPHATDDERRRLAARFAEVTAAYKALVA